jgi:hypothetical protein
MSLSGPCFEGGAAIGQAERRNRVTKISLGAITGIKQNDPLPSAGGFCRTNVVGRDL